MASRRGVAIGRSGQAEQAPQGVRLIGGAEYPSTLELGNEFAGDRLEVVRDGTGAQPESREARIPPFFEGVGQFGRGTGEDDRVAGVLAPGELIEPGLTFFRCRRTPVEEH